MNKMYLIIPIFIFGQNINIVKILMLQMQKVQLTLGILFLYGMEVLFLLNLQVYLIVGSNLFINAKLINITAHH